MKRKKRATESERIYKEKSWKDWVFLQIQCFLVLENTNLCHLSSSSHLSMFQTLYKLRQLLLIHCNAAKFNELRTHFFLYSMSDSACNML